jgi:hypothetical protein
MWAAAQEALGRVAQCEADSDYASALALYPRVDGGDPRALAELLESRREFTVRLARAAYGATEARAAELVADGDIAAAAQLYRNASRTIGVAELVAEAERKLAELEEGQG